MFLHKKSNKLYYDVLTYLFSKLHEYGKIQLKKKIKNVGKVIFKSKTISIRKSDKDFNFQEIFTVIIN